MRAGLVSVLLLLGLGACARAPLDKLDTSQTGRSSPDAGPTQLGDAQPAAGGSGEETGGTGVPFGTGGQGIGGAGGSPVGGMGGYSGVGGIYEDHDAGAAPDAAMPQPAAIAAACARPSQRSKTPVNVAEFLQRRWILCSDKGIGHRAQAGIEIRGDGRFALLGWTPDGHLAPIPGLENSGTLDLKYQPQSGQLDFEMDADGTFILHPTYQSGPDAIVLDNEGVWTYRYVSADAVMLPVTPAPYPIVDPQPPTGSCADASGPPNVVKTVDEARAAMVRRWLRCSKDALIAPTEAGIEITKDDLLYRLDRQADGTIVRAASPSADVSYIDTSAINGHPVIQVDFDFFGSGGIGSPVVVSQAPVFFWFNNNGVYHYRYRAAD